jgi:hypothetical protein
MRNVVAWIAAAGEEPKFWPVDDRGGHGIPQDVKWPQSPAHQPTGVTDPEPARWAENAVGNPELWFYRKRTIRLLHRYQRFSLETGRLPSIVGREFFRATVTSYRSVTFEDRVIFVRDVEKVLERLEYWDQQLVARVLLQEHSYDKAAYLLHCSRKTIQRRMPEVLDLLSEYFLGVGLLMEFPD